MKKILVLLVLLLFVLTACGNNEPIEPTPDLVATFQEQAEDAQDTAEAAWLETLYVALKEQQTATPYPTYTPYPTPIPTMTYTPTLDYDFCTENGGKWIRTLAKTKVYIPVLDDEGKVKTLTGNIVKVEVVPVKIYGGIDAGIALCGWELAKVTIIGNAWRISAPCSCGWPYVYIPAAKVERITAE